jgi:F0F1-type ATP synthase assembly protein I
MPADTNQSTETSSAGEATRLLNRSHGSFELALAPALMAAFGFWLDRAIDTVPVFTLVLAVLGIAGAAAKLYYQYRYNMAEAERDGAWVGHSSSAQFRADASARAERLSAPLEGER